MKENLKNQNGITLIALIITIIVLLILAVVSIKLVLDEGIITHAKNAMNEYNEVQTNELAQLTVAEEQMKQYGGQNQNSNYDWWRLSKEEIDELKKYPINESVTYEQGDYVIANNENSEGKQVIKEMGNDEKLTYGYVMIIDNNKFYFYILTDDAAYFFQQLYDSRMEGQGITFEKNKWYKTSDGSHFLDAVEYTGSSPIQLSDFADEDIYCRTYLQRIIDSFNN